MMDTVFSPRPAHHIHYTQRHFQRFADAQETLAEMEAENDPRIVEDLAIAKAMRGLMGAARVPKRFVDLKRDFDQVRDFEVVCPWQIDEQEELSLRMRLQEEGLKFKVLPEPVASFDDVRRVMHKSKGLIFPNVITGKRDNFWASQVLLPASVLVGKQLRDPKVNGNPMVMLSEMPERCEFEGILDHLKNAGMISQDLHFLYNRASKMSSAIRHIKEKALEHVKYDDPIAHRFTPLPETDVLMVKYLLSASSANPVDNDDAYAGAVNFGLNGYGLMSGMGAGAPMGWHVFGALQCIREGFDVVVQGVQDPHAMKTEGWPGHEMEKFMGRGHAVVAPDILVRIWQILEMEKLQQDNTLKSLVVTQGNGLGGLQEIASVLALKEAGVKGAERTSLIIENAPRKRVSGGVIGPHDALIDVLERRGELCAENGIYVSQNPRETLEIVAGITGKKLQFYDVQRPHNTIFPFAREKNPYYDWFIGAKGKHPAPSVTIRDVYERTHADLRYEQDFRIA